jgi:hypothetical protein
MAARTELPLAEGFPGWQDLAYLVEGRRNGARGSWALM